MSGLWEAHKRFGKLKWAEVVAPAIRYARLGFAVDDTLAGLAATENQNRFAGKTNFAHYFGGLRAGATSEPGKRPLSSMTPTIFLKDGKVALVIGAPGGSRTFTSIFQVVSNTYEFHLRLNAAIGAMRFHHQLLPANTVFWEPYAPISGQLAADLQAKGYNLANQGFNGDVQAIKVEGRVPQPVSDPRGRGVTSLAR